MMTRIADYGFAATYDGDTGSLNVARVALARWLVSVDGAAFVDDAQLVLSELASNAIEAAPGEPYAVDASLQIGMLEITVHNQDSGSLPARNDWSPAAVLADRGRGLLIVERLCDEVIVDDGDTSVSVTARLRR